MIKLNEIVSGQTVVCFMNGSWAEYEIVDTSARMKFNGTWYHCITYRPKYNSNYTIFVRTVDDFMFDFEVKKD